MNTVSLLIEFLSRNHLFLVLSANFREPGVCRVQRRLYNQSPQINTLIWTLVTQSHLHDHDSCWTSLPGSCSDWYLHVRAECIQPVWCLHNEDFLKARLFPQSLDFFVLANSNCSVCGLGRLLCQLSLWGISVLYLELFILFERFSLPLEHGGGRQSLEHLTM